MISECLLSAGQGLEKSDESWPKDPFSPSAFFSGHPSSVPFFPRVERGSQRLKEIKKRVKATPIVADLGLESQSLESRAGVSDLVVSRSFVPVAGL